jgi:epoxyqueuosine reductase
MGAWDCVSASARVKTLARELGFDLVGIATAEAMPRERAAYLQWIEAGRQGDMRWITSEHAERASDPRSVLSAARSVISLGLQYHHGRRPPRPVGAGVVARYAWGRDYHAVLSERLASLAAALSSEFGAEHRCYVDTGPTMDRALARRAGLGFHGKNTNLLTPRLGSWVLLGEIITTLDLQPDPPTKGNCGSCSLCVRACPTGALGPDYTIDARACISYLTIEHRGPIPLKYRPLMGAWVFGCDICQDVCPPSTEPFLRSREERRDWIGEVRRTLAGETAFAGEAAKNDDLVVGPLYVDGARPFLDLVSLLRLSHEDYLAAFRGTAIRRAKVWMLRRNAAVALGNVGGENAVAPLSAALVSDEHPVVRGHAAWALGRLVDRGIIGDAVTVMRHALDREPESSVRAEIELALQRAPATSD